MSSGFSKTWSLVFIIPWKKKVRNYFWPTELFVNCECQVHIDIFERGRGTVDLPLAPFGPEGEMVQ